jgi:phosphoglycolate phosphatase
MDGTLVQTRETSWLLFERTNREYQLGVDTREQYFDLFTENVFEALPKICPDPERALAAIEHFLGLMRSEYRPPLVPGMLDVVRGLSPYCALGIVSSNALAAIRRIADDAGIANCIAHVFAGDVVPDKRVAIRQFLADPSYSTRRNCSNAYEEEHPIPFGLDEVALVTDTVGDVRHAVQCGVRVMGVAWGLHSPEALRAAGAEAVAQWPQEIIAWAKGSRSASSFDHFPEPAREPADVLRIGDE